jgi:hypothetical protein
MQTHLFSYRHDGELWGLEIQARDAEDARSVRPGFISHIVPSICAPFQLHAVKEISSQQVGSAFVQVRRTTEHLLEAEQQVD